MPVLLMGYYNPLLAYGLEAFVTDAKAAGVDGCIIVDLPPEAAGDLLKPLSAAGLSFIPLITPTTEPKRIPLLAGIGSSFVGWQE